MSTVENPHFIKRDEKHVPTLNLKIECYEHEKTGALHFHLNADNKENVFLIGLRTVPMDSKGVAHILEHTALCGSKKYPVRDPFFMMIRRSLNTFMNAFTSSDWTAYPFASQNKKDFNNLLDVYLDAVFFSNLDELDYAQEGHRLEFEEMENPESALVNKGVVYNEMIGAMSSPISVLWQTLTEHVFPTTTYHYNSGGAPEVIPDLSYDELKAFYQTHYHPSNAVFFSYGDIPASEHQQRMHEQALKHFKLSEKKIVVPAEQRYQQPKSVTEYYVLEDEPSIERKTHVVLGWLLGDSIDMAARMRATLLSSVLLDNGSSPLRYALENTKLGNAPSPLCGLEDTNREMVFMCGLEACDAESTQEIEAMILKVLQDVAEKGVEQSRLDAALHQLELSQKEITGGNYPYGLQLILDMLPVAVHNGDTINSLDIDHAMRALRNDMADPAFFQKLVRELILNNQHRVCLTLKPDLNLGNQKERAEKEKLAGIKAKLSDEEKQAIVKQAIALKQRQERVDDESILPKVELSDIPDEMYIAQGSKSIIANMPAHIYQQGTNGIVYEQLVVELPRLSEDQLQILPLYARCLTELGSNGRDYLQTQALMDEVTGGISAYTYIRSDVNDVQQSQAFLILSGKALSRNQGRLADLMQETLLGIEFSELDRIREIVAQQKAAYENSITGNGHGLAMTASSAGFSPVAYLKHQTRGLAGIKKFKQLDAAIEDRAQLESLARRFSELHQLVIESPMQVLIVAEPSITETMFNYRMDKWSPYADFSPQNNPFVLPDAEPSHSQFWIANTQINFCAKSFPAVPAGHDDSAAFMVLGSFLKNGFLHRVIREQGGAYGGGAGYDSDAAAFRFYSYRDPRIEETLADFYRSIDWVLTKNHGYEKLEEAILGVIGSFDKPASPAGEAKNSFHNSLFGRTAEQRQALRKKVLGVTIDDLKRITETYLANGKSSDAVLSHQSAYEQLKIMEMTPYHL